MQQRQDHPTSTSLASSTALEQQSHASPVSLGHTSFAPTTSSTSTMHYHPPLPMPPALYAPLTTPQQPSNTTRLPYYSGMKDGWRYTLHVKQQPVRARMCGFGDKDRRPITPPPCVLLLVTDATTGKEIDINEVNSSFFVLNVDLCSEDGSQEVNQVRHASGTSNGPAGTTTTRDSYPPTPDRVQLVPPGYRMDPYPSYYFAPHEHHPSMLQGYPQQQMPVMMAQPAATGMFTRNLIGSLSVNACKLTDTEGKVGFWFILQDLSVRTEGKFRLRMNFVDVGGPNGNLNKGLAPVLATTCSDSFQVFSAKKFPGVIESTPLSKTFASQGIKIPIRKDPKVLSNQAEYDEDDDDSVV